MGSEVVCGARCDEAALVGVHHGLHAVAETEFLEDARDECLCRRFADHERLFAAHSAGSSRWLGGGR